MIDKGVGEYLDHENCKFRKKLVDQLVGEYSKNTGGNEIVYNATLNDYVNVCDSCTIYIVFIVIAFLISLALVVHSFILIGA